MTSIGGPGLAPMLSLQSLQSALTSSVSLVAKVLGATRHGVAVTIGEETLLLRGEAHLAEAKTLTLEPVTQASAQPIPVKEIPVRVTAIDENVLAVPIKADLMARNMGASSTESAVLKQGQIEVVAQPVTPDGKPSGPSLTLRLQTEAPDGAVRQAFATSAVPVAQPADAIRKSPVPTLSDRLAQQGQRLIPSGQPMASLPASLETGTRPLPLPHREGTIIPEAEAPKGEAAPDTMKRTPSLPTEPSLSSPKGAPLEQRRSADVIGRLLVDPASSLTTNDEKASIKPATMPVELQRPAPFFRAETGRLPPTQPSPIATSTIEIQEPIAATVVERGSGGRIVLQAAGRFYRIEQPIDLPLDAPLLVTFTTDMSVSRAVQGAHPLPDKASALGELIDLLDGIDRAARLASDADPDVPTSPRQLPAADRHLASRFLSLLAVTDGGLPPEERLPGADRYESTADSKSRIGSLVRDLGGMASEPLGEGWKSTMLPLGPDPAQAVYLFHREHALDSESETFGEDPEEGEAQRAVFDVSFTKLGRCQIDALCQSQRFDLLVRSERAFAQEDQQVIASVFSSACEIAGMAGDIGFRVGQFFEPARSPAPSRNLKT